MGNAVYLPVREIEKRRRFNTTRPKLNWKFIAGAILSIMVLGLAGLLFYQATRFNTHITINGINVGSLTAEQATKKLEAATLKNKVYIGKKEIFDGKDVKTGFTSKDVPNVKKLLKEQRTFFPTSNEKNYSIAPRKENVYQSQTLKKLLEEKLQVANKSLKAPQDAAAQIINGKIAISKSQPGEQYDVAGTLKALDKKAYNSEIYLRPVLLRPDDENSPKLKEEQNKLQSLLQKSVDYQVQEKMYSLKGSDMIKQATLSKNGQYVIDYSGIKSKVAEINNTQSTLNKYFSFKTHSGSVIAVKGESYGWAIDVDKEAKRIQEAFEKGEKSIKAYNIYGKGWSRYGVGYHVTTNNGIGNTYAEVSIKEQKIWLYKSGKLVFTTNVVTGWHGVNQDTPPGVWYVEFKETPSILTGSEVGNLNYSVKVNYWAPFTLSGCGFHDAGWRRDWSGNAYLTNGSGGCVNVPAGVMKNVYDNLVQNEPVIVY